MTTGPNVLLSSFVARLALCLAVLAGVAGIATATATVAGAAQTETWSLPIGISAGNGGLEAVSCSDALDCTAVGGAVSNSQIEPVTATESKGVWSTITTASTPSGQGGSFSAISCVDATDCTAVGNTNNLSQAFFASESGGVWSPTTALGSDENGFSAAGVSCSDSEHCTVVGAGAGDLPAYVTESGGAWGSVVDLAPPDTFGSFSAVSCADATDCTAVGNDDDYPSYADRPFFVTESAGVWGPATVVPGPGTAGEFSSVSCSDSNDCTAVGSGGTLDAYEYTAAIEATETAGSWSSFSMLPNPSGKVTQLYGVSCPKTGYCTAIGEAGRGRPAAATESSGSWSAPVKVLLPGNFFSGVSCPDTLDCTAVGEVDDGDNQTEPMAIRESTPTTLTLTAGSVPASPGGVPYTVSVRGTGPTPTGSVQVTDNDGSTCTIPTLDSGTGSCMLTESADNGPYTVTAAYGGDSNYGANTQTVVVNSTASSGGTASVGSSCVAAVAQGGSADGVDTLTETQDFSDPVGPLNGGQDYVALALSPGATFRDVSIRDCDDVDGSTLIDWWDPSAKGGTGSWRPVKSPSSAASFPYGQAFAAAPTPSTVSVSLTADSNPALSQLGGTIFAIAPAAAIPAPEITKVAPTSGQTGSEVTIKGTDLTRASVTLGGTSCFISTDTGSKIVLFVPANATTGKFKVTTPGGEAKSSQTFTVTGD